MAVVAVTQLHAPSTLCTTYTRTPSVPLTWLMDKLQRSDTLVGDLQSPRDHSLDNFSFCSKPTTKFLLHSAALCCLFRKLQLDRHTLKNSPFVLVAAICQVRFPMENVWHFRSLAWQPFVQDIPAELRKRTSLPLNLQALWNHHNKNTCEGDEYLYWH